MGLRASLVICYTTGSVMPEVNTTTTNTPAQPITAQAPAAVAPTAAPSDIGASEPTRMSPLVLANKRNQGTLLSKTLQLSELVTTLPLLFPSLIIQADNIAKHGGKEGSGVIGFASSVINVLSTPFRWIMHKYVARQHSDNDVGSNKRSFFYDDFFQRILHPNFVKEFTSFLFNTRRALFNFLPDVFTTPSEEHDPNNPEGTIISKSLANVFHAGNSFMSPIRWITTIATALLNIPSYVSGTINAYGGNQHLFNISKYFARLTDLFTPLMSNLSSLLSTTKAFIDSSKGESLSVAFGRYNIGFLNVFQGIVGSILAIPGFVGALVGAKDILLEKQENTNSLLVSNYVGDMVASVMPWIKAQGFLVDETVASSRNKSAGFVEKVINNTNEHVTKLVESVYNSSAFAKKIFSWFRPVDISGNVIADLNAGAIENKSKTGVVWGGFSKGHFFKEIHSLLHPIQSLLTLLPAAFVPISDPYITDNAKVSMRLIDRLFGINSLILSVPNYVIYALSTRIPQVIIKVFELKQKYARSQGRDYDAYAAFTQFRDNLHRISLPGTTYLQKALQELPVDHHTFQSFSGTERVLETIEAKAREQEPSTKAPELLQAFRIGAKALLARKGIFFADRDEQGFTSEEHSRMRIYNSLGTLKQGITSIPVIGWIASPFIEMFRNIYFVKPRRGRRQVPVAAPTTALDRLKQMMGPQQPASPQMTA